jgi:hypothetical protein
MIAKMWIMAACALLVVGQASAQGSASDVRCLLVSNAFANGANDVKAKEIARSARLFYGGRLSTRESAGLRREFAAQQKQLTPANAGPVMNSCAKEMTRRLEALEASGKGDQPARR